MSVMALRRLAPAVIIFALFCRISSLSAVEPGTFHADGPKSKKAIALTFDDGPGPYTTRILEVLAKHNVKATFFMSSEQVKYRKKLARKVAAEGHEIGDHTWGHVNFSEYEKLHGVEKTRHEVRRRITKSKGIIEETLEIKIRLCRMPHGYHRAWLKDVAGDFGYALVNWSFGEDWHKIPEEKMTADYLSAVKPGAILLFHDGGVRRDKTINIVDKVIENAREKGLQVIPAGELLR